MERLDGPGVARDDRALGRALRAEPGLGAAGRVRHRRRGAHQLDRAGRDPRGPAAADAGGAAARRLGAGRLPRPPGRARRPAADAGDGLLGELALEQIRLPVEAAVQQLLAAIPAAPSPEAFQALGAAAQGLKDGLARARELQRARARRGAATAARPAAGAGRGAGGARARARRARRGRRLGAGAAPRRARARPRRRRSRAPTPGSPPSTPRRSERRAAGAPRRPDVAWRWPPASRRGGSLRLAADGGHAAATCRCAAAGAVGLPRRRAAASGRKADAIRRRAPRLTARR